MKKAGPEYPTATPYLPPRLTLASLRKAAASCQGCPLYQNATQTVFGEGPKDARIVFIGEQPGDQEDRAGHPFVGPAGRELDQALAEAGLDRGQTYVTNAVKHFKFEPRGKRRMHAKPKAHEINACRPWLEAELTTIRPELVVCLGATAAQALLGRAFRVMRDRGRILPFRGAMQAMATIHPSAILRAPDSAARAQARADFVRDLRVAAEWLAKTPRRAR